MMSHIYKDSHSFMTFQIVEDKSVLYIGDNTSSPIVCHGKIRI